MFDNLNVLRSSEEKVETLAEMIYRAGDEPATESAALLVLMATLENATYQKSSGTRAFNRSR